MNNKRGRRGRRGRGRGRGIPRGRSRSGGRGRGSTTVIQANMTSVKNGKIPTFHHDLFKGETQDPSCKSKAAEWDTRWDFTPAAGKNKDMSWDAIKGFEENGDKLEKKSDGWNSYAYVTFEVGDSATLSFSGMTSSSHWSGIYFGLGKGSISTYGWTTGKTMSPYSSGTFCGDPSKKPSTWDGLSVELNDEFTFKRESDREFTIWWAGGEQVKWTNCDSSFDKLVVWQYYKQVSFSLGSSS